MTAGTPRGSGLPHGRNLAPAAAPPVIGEARWPMAAAVVAVIVLTVLLPHSLIVHPRWAVPIVEAVLLVAVMVGDPAKSTGGHGRCAHCRSP